MIPLHHAEQIVGSVLLMGENEHPNTLGVRRQPVVAATDVGRDTLLTSLQHEGAHLAGLGFLRLEPFMQIGLGMVEVQRSIVPAFVRIFRHSAA